MQSTRQGPFTKKELAWIAARLSTTFPIARPMNATLRRMVRDIHRAISNHPTGKPSPDATASLRLQIATILLEVAWHSGEPAGHQGARAVALAIAHMEQHYARGLQTVDLVEATSCSRSRLFALFKGETGMSPNDWLQRLRVKKAAELLLTTNQTIGDIALSVGFASQPYFCHVFRKYAG